MRSHSRHIMYLSFLCLIFARRLAAFVICPLATTRKPRKTYLHPRSHLVYDKTTQPTKSTALHAFNLPPPNKGPGDGLGSLASTLITLGLTVAFFLSPIGAFVLSIFNSLVLLAFLTPLLAVAGFNLWQLLNTVSGPCPSCGAPVTVRKRSSSSGSTQTLFEESPSLCFNCGAVVTASEDNQRIDIDSSLDPMSGIANQGFLESLFSSTQRTASPSANSAEEKAKQFRRDLTVIDVDVSADE
jgi:hypothetical protein